MNKKIMFLIFSVVGLLFLSCDWNYSKSPEVPHYEYPTIDDNEPKYEVDGFTMYFELVDEEQKHYPIVGWQLRNENYEIISFDEITKIVRVEGYLYNYTEGNENKSNSEDYFEHVTLVKPFDFIGSEEEFNKFVTKEKRINKNIPVYEDDKIISNEYDCMLYNLDIDIIKEKITDSNEGRLNIGIAYDGIEKTTIEFYNEFENEKDFFLEKLE